MTNVADAEDSAVVTPVLAGTHEPGAEVKAFLETRAEAKAIAEARAEAEAEAEVEARAALAGVSVRVADGWFAVADGSDKHGTYRRGEAVPQLVDAYEAVAIDVTEDGSVVGVTVRRTTRAGSVRELGIPADVITVTNPAPPILGSTGVAMLPYEAKLVAQLVRAIIDDAAVPRREVLNQPGWRDDELLVPGPARPAAPGAAANGLEGYGHLAALAEADARELWAGIVTEAAAHPKLVVALGSAVGSMYLMRLGRDPYLLHLAGETRTGKTSTTAVSMATVGDPNLLLQTWSTTANAVQERLTTARILPVALDEISASGLSDEELEKTLFASAGGRRKARAGKQGGVLGSGRWALVVISSGERTMRSVSGLVGLQSRTVELRSPVTTSATTIDTIYTSAVKAFGWPMYWIVAKPDVQNVIKDMARATKVLEAFARTPVTKTTARHLAGAVVGWRALCRVAGVPHLAHIGLTAALNVLREIELLLLEDGESAGARLLAAIDESIAREPTRWSTPAGIDPDAKVPFNGLLGITGLTTPPGAVGLFKSGLEQLAKAIGLKDPQPALRTLRATGQLHPGDGEHLQKRVRVGSLNPRMYVVTL